MSIKAKIALAVLLVLVLCYSVAPVSAENQVTIHFFYNEPALIAKMQNFISSSWCGKPER